MCNQRWRRGATVRVRVARQRHAALAIQAAWRCARQRRAFARVRACVTVLQAAVRMRLCRQRYRSLRAAAVTVQASAILERMMMVRSSQAPCIGSIGKTLNLHISDAG